MSKQDCKTRCDHQKNMKIRGFLRIMFGKKGRQLYICNVFHGIRFKVSKDWLSRDNQFFLYLPPSTPSASWRHAYYKGHSLFRRSSSQHKQHMSLKRLFSLSYLQKMRRRVKVFFFLFVLLHKMLTSISQYHEHHVTTIP